MMSMMRVRTVLPLVLTLTLLLLAAGAWWWQAGPAWADDPEDGEAAHQHADYKAPAVTLAGHSVCSSHVNRTLVLAGSRD